MKKNLYIVAALCLVLIASFASRAVALQIPGSGEGGAHCKLNDSLKATVERKSLPQSQPNKAAERAAKASTGYGQEASS